MTSLPEKITAVHRALTAAELPHAFGGALALAFCTRDARGTHDIDVNVLVDVDRAAEVVSSLPDGVAHDADDLALLVRDGQVRLWWDEHPVDVFLDTTDFHRHLPRGVVQERYRGDDVPFLGCDDLAVFKAFFDRPKDWGDLGEMLRAGALDVEVVLGTLVRHLGGDDRRIEKLRALAAEVDGGRP